MEKNNFVIYYSSIVLWLIAIFSTLFGAGFTILVIKENDYNAVVICMFSIFTVLGIFGLIFLITWRIRVEDNKIIYSSFAFIRKTIIIREITKIKLIEYTENHKPTGSQVIEAYAGDKKLFKVASGLKGYNLLISRFEKEQIPILYDQMEMPVVVSD